MAVERQREIRRRRKRREKRLKARIRDKWNRMKGTKWDGRKCTVGSAVANPTSR